MPVIGSLSWIPHCCIKHGKNAILQRPNINLLVDWKYQDATPPLLSPVYNYKTKKPNIIRKVPIRKYRPMIRLRVKLNSNSPEKLPIKQPNQAKNQQTLHSSPSNDAFVCAAV
jgi:hypothetical protein